MKVFIGVDPHKLSATIEVVDARETVLTGGRFSTDKAGYAAMRKQVAAWPDRVWAVEGSSGAGRPLAQRLLADGEYVVDPGRLQGDGTRSPTTQLQWSRLVHVVPADLELSMTRHRDESRSRTS